MKKVLWILFSVSVAANIWLFSQRHIRPSVASSASSSTSLSSSAGSMLSRVAASAHSATALADSPAAIPLRARLVKALASLDSTDLDRVRDQLIAEGAEASFVYGIVDGIGRVRYSDAQRAAELENLRNGWWRGNPARGANLPSWTKIIQEPVFKTVGADPLELVDYSSRFTFLPPDKARRFAQMGADFNELQARVSNNGRVNDPVAREMLSDARRQEVLDVLTPEERAEYDLRFSEASAQNAFRFTRMQATEKEFRAIQPLIEQLQAQTSSLPRDQNSYVALALEQQTFDKIVAAIGPDRAIDYLWSNTLLTGSNSLSLALNALPSSPYAGQVLQLAAETGAAAAAIHADPYRSADEKRAALVALERATQPKLNDIIPPETQQQLPSRALSWLRNLSNGEYTVLTPHLSGRGAASMRTISVTSATQLPPSILLGPTLAK